MENFDFGKFTSPTRLRRKAPGGISRILPKTWNLLTAARTLVTLSRWRSSAGRRGVVVVSLSAPKLCLLHYWFSASASLAATVPCECLFCFFFHTAPYAFWYSFVLIFLVCRSADRFFTSFDRAPARFAVDPPGSIHLVTDTRESRFKMSDVEVSCTPRCVENEHSLSRTDYRPVVSPNCFRTARACVVRHFLFYQSISFFLFSVKLRLCRRHSLTNFSAIKNGSRPYYSAFSFHRR